MDDREFTKLSLLAAAIVNDPSRFEESLSVIQGGEPEIQLERQSEELEEALTAMKSKWSELVSDGREPTIHDVVALGKALEKSKSPEVELAGRILLSLARRQLAKTSSLADGQTEAVS
jgi:hypothetical protein